MKTYVDVTDRLIDNPLWTEVLDWEQASIFTGRPIADLMSTFDGVTQNRMNLAAFCENSRINSDRGWVNNLYRDGAQVVHFVFGTCELDDYKALCMELLHQGNYMFPDDNHFRYQRQQVRETTKSTWQWTVERVRNANILRPELNEIWSHEPLRDLFNDVYGEDLWLPHTMHIKVNSKGGWRMPWHRDLMWVDHGYREHPILSFSINFFSNEGPGYLKGSHRDLTRNSAVPTLTHTQETDVTIMNSGVLHGSLEHYSDLPRVTLRWYVMSMEESERWCTQEELDRRKRVKDG